MKKKNAYFIGIAGAGVSALASILDSEDYIVSGSDEGVFDPIKSYLDNLGVKYFTNFDKANLPAHIDIAIIGTSAKINPDTNPEFQEILSRKTPYFTFAQFLAEHTKTRDNLVIAGSFGKSSLTALITHILVNAGKNPGWFIGAIAKNLSRTGASGQDKEFIMEGDEYVISLADRRSKFELYKSKDILISSIVHDHVNMFPTMSEYEEKFYKLIQNLPEDGKIIACNAYDPIKRLINKANKAENAIYYDISPCDGFYSQNIKIDEITSFELITPNNEIIQLETSQLGLHNVENIIAASAYLLSKNLVTIAQLQEGVKNFAGVSRRLDKKTIDSKVPVYEGFGSSYEKARSAIEAIKLHFPTRSCIVIFEPHTFSWRNREFLHWYDEVFKGVDFAYILPPPTHGANNHQQLSHQEICERAKNSCNNIIAIHDADDCISKIMPKLKGDEVILLLSSGSLYGLAKSLPEMLENKNYL